MKYRINKYLTLNGIVLQVSLADSAYGECIVYENFEPKYHINIFNNESKSDCLLYVMMNENESRFEDILTEINKRFKRSLTLSSKTNFGIKINSELIDYELSPIPFKWISHYSELIKPPWEIQPDKNPNDLYWRKGIGKEMLSIFTRYYDAHHVTEKKEFEKKFRPTNEWSYLYK